MSMANRNLGYI